MRSPTPGSAMPGWSAGFSPRAAPNERRMSPRDFPGVKRLLRFRFGDRSLEREVDAEIRSHIAMRIEQLVARGWSEEAARAEAARRFGNLTDGRRQVLAAAKAGESRMRRRESFDALRHDTWLAIRQLRRAPGFAALAIATFAIGIALTSAVFAVLDGVLLKPLPVEHPERLV